MTTLVRWLTILACIAQAALAQGNRQAQIINWGSLPDTQVWINHPYPLNVTANSGLPVTVAVVSGPAEVTNGNLVVTNLGTIDLVATQEGNAQYFPVGWNPMRINHTKVDFARVGQLPQLTNGLEVAFSPDGRLALLASGYEGTWVVDLADPTEPRIRSRLTNSAPSASHLRVEMVGDLACVLVNGVGLELWSLQDPDLPVRVGATTSGSGATDLAVDGGFAYLVGDGLFNLRIIDVRDPAAPVEAGHLLLDVVGASVATRDGYAFVGGQGGAFLVVDARQPDQAKTVGRLNLGCAAHAIELAGSVVIYVGAYGCSGAAVDISVPSSPKLIGPSQYWQLTDVTVQGSGALGVSPSGIIAAWDLGYPPRFSVEGSFGVMVPGRQGSPARQTQPVLPNYTMAWHDGVACVAGDEKGLLVLRARRGMEQYLRNLPPQNLLAGNPPVSAEVLLSSGLPATVRLISGPAILSNGMLTGTGEGRVELRIEQAGNEQFLPVAETFLVQVTKAPLQVYPGTVTLVGPDQLSFRIFVAPGATFTLQGSDDLKTWIEVPYQLTSDNEPLVTVQASSAHRYFRLQGE